MVLSAVLVIGGLIVLLALGTPMIVALTSAVSVGFLLSGQWALGIPQSMVSGVSNFTLMALPLFVLAGTLMNASGISTRLVDFARSLVGWLRGGLAQVNVLTSMFFGGMIGSSTADLAGTGSVIIPAMKREKYSSEMAAAITASSSGIGPLIPPSSPMILYSAITGTSLGALFLAGLIPGLILGALMMSLVAALAHLKGWSRSGAFSMHEVWATGRRAILPFGMPVIIVGGLVLGVFTPTEGASFAAVYALMLATIIYRTLDFRGVYRVFANAVQVTGELLVIVMLSFALGSSLANLHVPDAIAAMIETVAVVDSMYLRIAAIMLLAIIAGMFLDPLTPVFVPIILPTLILYGIDTVHFGVLLVFAVVIGQLTPPLAIALIITGRIAECDQLKIFKANLPFFLLILACMLALIALPGLATWLPNYVRG